MALQCVSNNSNKKSARARITRSADQTLVVLGINLTYYRNFLCMFDKNLTNFIQKRIMSQLKYRESLEPGCFILTYSVS